jgi:hypothetical protein
MLIDCASADAVTVDEGEDARRVLHQIILLSI